MKNKTKNTQMKLIALILILLVLTLTITQPVNAEITAVTPGSAGQRVTLATGDLALAIPLITIPGQGGLNYPIELAYSGGSGIPINEEASWVGLGWALGPGIVTRSAIGAPDDMSSSNNKGIRNVYQEAHTEVNDKRTWFDKVVEILPQLIFSAIVTYITAGIASSLSAALNWGKVGTVLLTASFSVATTIAYQGGITVSQVILTFAQALTGLDAFSETTFADAMDIYGKYGALTSRIALFGYLFHSQTFGKNMRDNIQTQSGFLYAPHFQETYREENQFVHDGGQPDFYSVSGSPASGRLLIANEEVYYDKNTLKKSVDKINDVKFYLQTTPGIQNANVIAIYNKDYCQGSGITSKPFPNCQAYSEDIDQFIVITADGTRYIYGDPTIEGSVVRIHADGMYSNKEYWPDSKTQVILRYGSIILQHYPYAWKLVAILSSDYVDGNDDSDPLNSETTNKGSWIAFRYNPVYKYVKGGNCGYNYGNTRSINNENSGIGEVNVGGFTQWAGGYKDISYLKEIITPTHKAVFTIALRKDGKETQPWYLHLVDEHATKNRDNRAIGPWSFNWQTGYFNEKSYDSYAANCNALSKDYLYKLDKIELKSRQDNNSVISAVKFNKDESDQYKLAIGAPDATTGRYTLKNVAVCNPLLSDCITTKFYYGHGKNI